MAIETIKQVLQEPGTPNLNGVQAQSLISRALLENIFQGIVESNGRGISDKYATETEVNANAQIFVNRIIPHNWEAREMGASKNGRSFSDNGGFAQTETVGIEVLTVVDDPIIIPRARQDTISVDLLAQELNVFGAKLNTIINGATCAAHLLTPWKSEMEGGDYNAVAVGDDKLSDKLIEANSLLDEGDDKHGIDVYPTDSRIAVFKMGARPVLKASGVLVIGGSNYAQTILAGREISVGAVDKTLENGYWGDIDGVPCHGLSNESLAQASRFLGFGRSELKKGDFMGYIASALGSGRGVSMIGETKIVDTRGGQGIELQPFAKMGAVSWYPLSQALIYKGDSTKGLLAKLKEIFSADYGKCAFKVKGGASRLFPVFDTFTAGASSTTVKVAALDDNNVDHLVKVAYVVTTGEVDNVSDFYKAYTATGAVKGYIPSGTATSISASGKYVTCLAIADDGSCTVLSKAAA